MIAAAFGMGTHGSTVMAGEVIASPAVTAATLARARRVSSDSPMNLRQRLGAGPPPNPLLLDQEIRLRHHADHVALVVDDRHPADSTVDQQLRHVLQRASSGARS